MGCGDTPSSGVTNLNLKLFSENIGKMMQLAKTNQYYSLKKWTQDTPRAIWAKGKQGGG